MNSKLRRKTKRRKQRMLDRIDKGNWSGTSPMIRPTKVRYELAEKQQAIAAGGLGAVIALADRLNLRQVINNSIHLFKQHLPYDEADHVLNIAFNLLAGGTCLEHLEDRRCDEAYLNALRAERIPDPTTAGDFCRRFQTTAYSQKTETRLKSFGDVGFWTSTVQISVGHAWPDARNFLPSDDLRWFVGPFSDERAA